MKHQLEAGAAKIDITPPLGTLINGDFIPHYARFIHDPLFAKALVLQNEKRRVAFVVVDICLIHKELIDVIKIQIQKETGITPENILISATHTHAAGSVTDTLLTGVDIAYSKKIPGLIVNAVLEAIKNLNPAKIGFSSVEAPDHVLCRRYFMKEGYTPLNPVSGNADIIKTNPFNAEEFIDRPENILDPQVCYLAVRGMDDRWISILSNYSMHYVGDWENGTISADYFGVFARKLREKLTADDGFIGIMSNGTSGECNTWDFLHPGRYPTAYFAKSELIGNELAEKIVQSIDTIQWDSNPELNSLYEEVELAVRKPSTLELESARKMVSDTDYRGIKNIDTDNLRRIYAREQVLLNEFPDIIKFPVHAIKIGNGVIGGLGGEIFAATGLFLKQTKVNVFYFTIGLANGNEGYVPLAHEFEKGGYETWRCRSSHLEVNAESKIRNSLKKLVKELAG